MMVTTRYPVRYYFLSSLTDFNVDIFAASDFHKLTKAAKPLQEKFSSIFLSKSQIRLNWDNHEHLTLKRYLRKNDFQKTTEHNV